MATAQRPQTETLPALSSAWVRLFIEKTQDLTLVLDHHSIVIDAFHSDSFSAVEVSHWIGHPIRAIVGPESIGKIDLLLSNDVSEIASDARWRHINLAGKGGTFIPVLARYLVLKSNAREAQMLVLRDLRALQSANDRFAAAQRELEHDFSQRLRKLEQPARVPTDFSVGQVLEQLEISAFDKVIAETAAALEKRCLMALLKDSGGSHEVAAKAARMPITDWLDKLKKHHLL